MNAPRVLNAQEKKTRTQSLPLLEELEPELHNKIPNASNLVKPYKNTTMTNIPYSADTETSNHHSNLTARFSRSSTLSWKTSGRA